MAYNSTDIKLQRKKVKINASQGSFLWAAAKPQEFIFFSSRELTKDDKGHVTKEAIMALLENVKGGFGEVIVTTNCTSDSTSGDSYTKDGDVYSYCSSFSTKSYREQYATILTEKINENHIVYPLNIAVRVDLLPTRGAL
ncbi:MAG: hypothetical protein OEY79_02140, partial [Anaplasmataceae bacterium]|nr:hypothetical protein [Anaplasmataceae bacterium]